VCDALQSVSLHLSHRSGQSWVSEADVEIEVAVEVEAPAL
jgi:hypothetical protein